MLDQELHKFQIAISRILSVSTHLVPHFLKHFALVVWDNDAALFRFPFGWRGKKGAKICGEILYPYSLSAAPAAQLVLFTDLVNIYFRSLHILFVK